MAALQLLTKKQQCQLRLLYLHFTNVCSCTGTHVHLHMCIEDKCVCFASVWVLPLDVVINVSLQRGSIGRWALPYNGPSLAAYSGSNATVRGSLFTCLAQNKPAGPPVLIWKECIVGVGKYKTGESSWQYYLFFAYIILIWTVRVDYVPLLSQQSYITPKA